MMNQVRPDTSVRDGVLKRLKEVLAAAADQVGAMDDGGIMSRELYEQLESTGVFQALTPKMYGGLELSLQDVNEALIEGGRVSGSIGWVMMIHTQQSLGMGAFPKETGLRLLRERGSVRTRGVAAPKGTATPTEGGYIVSGTWPFASGGPDPDFVAANCVVIENGAPRIGPSDFPELILAWTPAAQVEFLDTWHVLGLRGTNSCDIRIKDVFVPTEMTASLFTGRNFFETPVARLPLRVVLAPSHAAVAIGIAQGALEEIVELSKTKRAAMNPLARLSDDPLFRHHIGHCELRLQAVRAFLEKTTVELEAVAAEGRPLTPRQIMQGRAMTGHITAECIDIVERAYRLAGSASVYDTCPLERRLRDIYVAGQHISCFEDLYRLLGTTLLGEELSEFELLF
jgi:alkylation response protein AidB-like acyl-CoA dehydrogenase